MYSVLSYLISSFWISFCSIAAISHVRMVKIVMSLLLLWCLVECVSFADTKELWRALHSRLFLSHPFFISLSHRITSTGRWIRCIHPFYVCREPESISLWSLCLPLFCLLFFLAFMITQRRQDMNEHHDHHYHSKQEFFVWMGLYACIHVPM